MDACEIANFLATELFMQQFVSLDGIQSGVPTLTTSTLTPTTLRNIEQTLIELTADPPVTAPYQAGFVPPVAPPFHITGDSVIDNDGSYTTDTDSQSSYNNSNLNDDNSMAATDNSIATYNGSPSSFANITGDLSTLCATNTSTPEGGTKRRNLGGRRPQKPSNLSPEEEEKRRVRRERNKLAAARCRKRRVDQTNDLCEKVKSLENVKGNLQKEIEKLMAEKDDLDNTLKAHGSTCVLNNGGPINHIHTKTNDIFKNGPLMCNGRISPLDIKPNLHEDLLNAAANAAIKSEPEDNDDFSGDDDDGISCNGPTPAKQRKLLRTDYNPTMFIPEKLPNVSTIITTLSSASAALLNTPTFTTNSSPLFPPFLSQLHLQQPKQSKQRPNSLNVPQLPTDINGVAITTPSNGVFNFDSLMDGRTGLTPTCSSQNKHPLSDLTTPATSEPSTLVSL